MPTYKIIWEIELDSDNPVEAAKECLKYLQDSDSICNVFDVTDTETNETTTVDLIDYFDNVE